MPSLAPVISAHVPFDPNCASYIWLAERDQNSIQYECPQAPHRLRGQVLTDVPGRTNKLAIMRQNEKILRDSHRRPMNAKICVVGDAQ